MSKLRLWGVGRLVSDCSLCQRLGRWQAPRSSLSAGILAVLKLRASCSFADGCAVIVTLGVLGSLKQMVYSEAVGTRPSYKARRRSVGNPTTPGQAPSHCQPSGAPLHGPCPPPHLPIPSRVHSPLPEPSGLVPGDRGASDISGHAGGSNKALGSLNKEDMGFSQWLRGSHLLLCPHMTQRVTSGLFLFF